MSIATNAGRRDLRWAVASVCFLLLVPATASASHYVLSSIDLVDEATVGRMAALGIETTEDLWRAAAPGRKANTLARRLKVGAAQVRQWRAFCDLLRLDGVGPKVARVLTAAGLSDLKAVSRQDPEALMDRIRTVNMQVEILGKTPDTDTVRAWVEQARRAVQADGAAAKRSRTGRGAARSR
jgi:predicted flap endonuclease-1-like 5' DNA nuclease